MMLSHVPDPAAKCMLRLLAPLLSLRSSVAAQREQQAA